MYSKDIVEVDNDKYLRIMIKTDVINREDNLQYLLSFAEPFIKDEDVVFLSEKVISIIEDRIIHEDDVSVSRIAQILSTKVSKTPGANLTNEKAMQVAINEVGLIRILFAAIGSVIGKIFGKKGVFYKIAGSNVRGIDSPSPYAVKPYDKYISLAPLRPDLTAKKASLMLSVDVCILDANYRGVNILGCSNDDMDIDLYRSILIDNPMGQRDEQTPICIVRKL